MESGKSMENHATEEKDLQAIQEFRDREETAGHWSHKVEKFVPGAKVSPLFVVWQMENHRSLTITQLLG